ncbi:hypothetical protein [Microvirga calopogonii]|uniref:hypothetical protein n=1 Tax=Microvirga calopogonii TaxID=2078013 RepID=UPI000E0E067F|nr:hypothetical protein [Microvirga calopogonii]
MFNQTLVPRIIRAKAMAIFGFLLAACSPMLPPIMETASKSERPIDKVSSLHPIGSKSENLIEELKTQGFEVTLRPGYDRKLNPSRAYYDARKKLWGSIIPCTALISWVPDDQDNIREYQTVMMGCANL